jgi:putative transposase
VKPGYPRFKGKARFDSVEWPKDGDGARRLPEQRRVYLQGIGHIKVDLHRQVQGRVKTIQIKRQGRRWAVVLSCDDVPTNPLAATGRQAGVDVGIVSFATTSDGERIDNPRWGRQAEDRLTAAQQRLARAKRRSNNRQQRRETVAARHRKIANQRKDFHHKQARTLVERYDLVVVEDLRIANMMRRANPVADVNNPGRYLPNGARAKSGLNRSIGDAG